MERRIKETGYVRSLSAFLCVLVVCGHFIDQCTEGSGISKGLFLFIYSFHMPMLFFLAGTIFHDIENDTRKVKQSVIYSLCLYVIMIVITGAVRIPIRGKFYIDLLSESGAPWMFLAIVIYFTLAYCLREVERKNVLLGISIVVGVLCGYIEQIGDFLALSRVLVFMPFFISGWICGIDRIERATDKKRIKCIGGGILVAALFVFVYYAKECYFLRPLFTGRNPYIELGDRYLYGPLYRLLVYVISAVLLMSTLAAMPRIRLGKLIDNVGKRAVSILILHWPVLHILMGFGFFDALDGALGQAMSRVVWAGCALLCVLFLSVRILERPFTAMFRVLTGIMQLISEGKLDYLYDQLGKYWDDSSKRKKILLYVLAYTGAFLIAFLIAFRPFLNGKMSFVWSEDGRYGYYPQLIYIGKSLRSILQAALKGDFSVPLFDLNMNMGDDLLGNFNPSGGTAPLVLLSALIPAQYSEYLYGFIAIFRIYLAGLSFSALCLYFKKPCSYALIGSIVYCFSSYGMVCAMRHPFFVIPMYILPLMIMGVDQVLNQERSYIFIISVFLAALNEGYYFLYMMTIMTGVYVLVRFFDIYKEQKLVAFLRIALRGILYYILGIGLSLAVFLPSVFAFLSSGRAGYSNYNPTVYTWEYFRLRLLRFIAPSPGVDSAWSYPAHAAIVLFALVLLYRSKRRFTLKALAAITVLAYLSSVGGLIMNGFQYPSTRWVFGLALLMAYIVVEMMPELLNLSLKQRIICACVVCMYAAICFSTPGGRKTTYVLVGLVFLVTTLLVLTMPLREQTNGAEIYSKGRDYRVIICLLLVVANVGANGIYIFASDQGNYIAEFAASGEDYKRLEDAAEREMEPYYLTTPEGRADGTTFTRNTSMVWGIPTMLAYSATLIDSVVDFWIQIDRPERYSNFWIASTDQRAITNTLLSTKYHVEPPGKTAYVPYGYTQIEETEKGNIIYENNYALPWGYTYDNAISYDVLERLNGLQKQEAMLQAVALETSDDEGDMLQFDEYAIPYEIGYNNCKWEDGTFVVSKANATVNLTFDMPAGVEGYLYLPGFDINDSGRSSFTVTARCDDVSKMFLVKSNLNERYYGRENYLINLGYSEKARTSLTVTFPSTGTFKLDNIVLYALPMDNYPSRVEALRAEPLENIEWSTNHLSGTVDLSGDKMLCVSVPYSRGWSATVDGEKVEILRGNYMFMVIPLTVGHHDIEFSYCPPGLKFGAVVTVISAGILIWMLIQDRKRKGTASL